MKKTVRVINISEWIMIAAGSVFLIGMIQGGSSPILIGDETFSMKLVENSFSEIIRLTALDVHPPLYYILLKVVVELGNLVSLNPVISGKLASILPFLLLGVVSMTKIRKRFGGFAASFFFMSIMGMPQMMNYSVNIRMYSWGMFFVVMAFLAFCDIILENKFKPAILQFIIYSVMAAYTHYFACIGIAFLYFALLLYWYRYHREKIKTWFLCAAIICICYLPWIPIVYRQVGGVKEGYWIEPITLTSIIQFFQFLFNPAVYAYHSGTILGAALFLIVLAVLFLHGK
ncbi:MAG: hypothetical protein J6C33_01535, partial [Lachnospiraceae bacterium]|nr:hypothetical protein [Lachnospiraceae bacterium]